MTTHVVRPSALAPEELDNYLSRGWFRMGHALATSRFVVFGGVLRSALWMRVPVQRFRPSRSARRLMRRNGERFVWRSHTVRTDPEHEALYQRYRAHARGDRASSLVQFLNEGAIRQVFDTREISVWDGDRLVAFSWYDVGRRSVESLIGVYEPSYARHSLGFYTMLMELEQAANDERAWYYPGYVLPGEPSMDYKLRLGPAEFLHPTTGRWVDAAEANGLELPDMCIRRRLHDVAMRLKRRGHATRMRVYRLFDAPAWHPGMRDCLDQPILLELPRRSEATTWRFLCYLLETEHYVMFECARGTAISTDGTMKRSMPVMIVAAREDMGGDAESVANRLIAGV